MSPPLPAVDVNLIVHDGAAHIAAAIESVLAQTWPALTLTVLDNGSTDATPEIVRAYMRDVPALRLLRVGTNAGQVASVQRAFGCGEAPFVLPKTADDVVDPRYVERLLAVLLAHPDCAMCHAGARVFSGAGAPGAIYPETHRLHAIGADPLARARHVMERYTSAPAFWGVYRRSMVERCARLRYCAGWDHAFLAELALYGEIRHVPDLLYFRRDGGRPVAQLARGCTEAAQRGLPSDDALGDLRWMLPLVATAHAHVETFAVARLPQTERARLMQDAARIFRTRWHALMRREAEAFLAALPGLRTGADAWRQRQIADALAMLDWVLPELGIAARAAA
jgi:glycosyltransferase involved in cell wall biosynthesis